MDKRASGDKREAAASWFYSQALSGLPNIQYPPLQGELELIVVDFPSAARKDSLRCSELMTGPDGHEEAGLANPPPALSSAPARWHLGHSFVSADRH